MFGDGRGHAAGVLLQRDVADDHLDLGNRNCELQ
jgi:hypothetical protein